jgi:hypothetical protein
MSAREEASRRLGGAVVALIRVLFEYIYFTPDRVIVTERTFESADPPECDQGFLEVSLRSDPHQILGLA